MTADGFVLSRPLDAASQAHRPCGHVDGQRGHGQRDRDELAFSYHGSWALVEVLVSRSFDGSASRSA